MSGRPWLRKDRDLFAAQYGTRPLVELAVLLGRTETALRLLAWRLGLCRRRARLDPKLANRLVRLHAKGLSNRAIARRAGLHYSTCRRFLVRLGLTLPRPPGGDPRALTRQALARKRLARSRGYRDWPIYMLSRRRLRYDARYPGCATRVQAIVCELLEAGGPMTRATLARAAGASGRPSQRAREALRQLLLWEMVRQDERGLYHLVRRR